MSAEPIDLEDSAEDLYENAPCGFLCTRPDGTIVRINGTLLTWIGHERDALLAGKRFQDLLPVAGRIFYETHLAPLLQMQGFVNEIALEITRADGTCIPVLVNTAQKKDADGRVILNRMAVFTAMDRRKYERELLFERRKAVESEERYRFLAESIPHMVWTAAADGPIDYVNTRWTDYTGLSVDMALGWNWSNLLHPNDRAGAQALWRAAVGAGTRFSAEYRLRGRDGQYRWFVARAEPFRDDQGQIVRWFGTATDIEDAKRVEQVLREREKLFHALAEALPQLVWISDSDGKQEYFNQRWRDYTGVSLLELENDAWSALLHAEDREATVRRWCHSLATGEPYQTEYRLRGADSEYRWFLARAMAVRDEEGNLVRWFGTATDITDFVLAREALARSGEELQRLVEERTAQLEDSNWRLLTEMEERVRAQEALQRAQKLEAIGQLTGGVAHDFNNLLQVIGGNLQLLQRRAGAPEETARRLQSAMGAVERGAKLASQLLSFARRQPLEPKVVNLGRFVRNMDDLLRRALGEEIEIETIIAGGLWNTLADPDKAENVILNLAVNARDAMNGVGKLTIELGNAMLDDHYARQHEDVTAGQYIMLAVTDTGCGMPPKVIERVFEPFFSTKPEGKGTGLGLSMVYGFVKQSSGHVKIYSEVGIGTTIKIYLPRAHQAEEIAVDIRTAPVEGGTETILVVEDDPAVQTTVVDLLRDLGYRVLKAPDAQSAMTIIGSGAGIDLLFTDVVMPGPLRSTDLARQAQAAIPGLAVLFTSGYTQNAIVHGGRLDPGVSLLSKPYTREDLARKVRHLLTNRNLQQSTAAPAKPETDVAMPRKLRILLVEDDALIQLSTAEMLEALGHNVVLAADAEEAECLLKENCFDVLFTDVSLPGRSGVELAYDAVRRLSGLDVIIASGYGRGVVEGMNAPELKAAYLSKPYTFVDVELALRGLGRSSNAAL